jgi:hypothetical protein
MDLEIINSHFNLEENIAYHHFSRQLHTTWFHLLKPLFDLSISISLNTSFSQ